MDGTDRSIDVLMMGRVADVAADPLEEVAETVAVESTATASGALERLDAGWPDCVIVTHAPPDTDGLGLLDAVRERRPHLPVILVTDDGDEELARRAIAADVTDYLRMPTTADRVERLANRVQEAVGRADPTRWLRELAAASDDVHWMFTADWTEVLFINDAYELLC